MGNNLLVTAQSAPQLRKGARQSAGVRAALSRRQAEGLVKRCCGPQRARSEQALVLSAKRGGARQREDLIEALRPSIAAVARRYRHAKGVSHAELMQEGIVGLLRGLERFDPQRGVPFWAYASWWVRQAMQQLVAELSRPIVPLQDRALRGLAHVKETRRTLEQNWGREPTRHELTRAADVPSAHLERLMCADQAPRGLQEPVSDQTTGATTLGDLVDDRTRRSLSSQWRSACAPIRFRGGSALLHRARAAGHPIPLWHQSAQADVGQGGGERRRQRRAYPPDRAGGAAEAVRGSALIKLAARRGGGRVSVASQPSSPLSPRTARATRSRSHPRPV